MREVADLARVSVGTVSNVVNSPDRVLPATRERVEAAIEELGWVPNRQAQQLRAGRGRTVGLAVMDVTNPFFADVLRGAQNELGQQGYSATIGDADNDPERQARILRGFLAQRVRGVILGPIGGAPAEVDTLKRADIATVLVDRAAHDTTCCTVGVDDVAGGRIAVEHLLTQGHKNLAFVGGPASLDQIRDRLEGAGQAAAAAGAHLLSIPVPHLDFAAGRRAAEQFASLPLEQRPTGIFCANDLTAIGLLHGLLQQGLRVPQDVAIVGYDNIDFAEFAAVPLTSVAQPRRELGQTAATLLLAELVDQDANQPHVHRSQQFTPTLIARASTTGS